MMIKQRCFSLLKNQKKQIFNFNKLSNTMKTQKITNFLNDSSNEKSKFAAKTWYVLDIQTKKDQYKQGDTIKFETEIIKSSLCDYSDAFISVTGNITANSGDNTDDAFKFCAAFSKCTTKIKDVVVDEANRNYIEMPMYNLIEYSNNLQIHQEVYDISKEMKFLIMILI